MRSIFDTYCIKKDIKIDYNRISFQMVYISIKKEYNSKYSTSDEIQKLIANKIIINTFENKEGFFYNCKKCDKVRKQEYINDYECICGNKVTIFCPNCGNFFDGTPDVHLSQCKFIYLKTPCYIHLFYYNPNFPSSCLHHRLNPNNNIESMSNIYDCPIEPINGTFHSYDKIGEIFKDGDIFIETLDKPLPDYINNIIKMFTNIFDKNNYISLD